MSVGQRPVYCALCTQKLTEHRGAPLTKRQGDIYAYLREYVETHHYAPTLQEIAEHFGNSALSTVSEHLAALERKDWIRRAFHESRGITLLIDTPLSSPRNDTP